MCQNKDQKCSCNCENNSEFYNDITQQAIDFLNRKKLKEMANDTDTKKEDEDVVIIDGVEYVRKNKIKVLEEPTIPEKDGKILLNE